MKDIDIIYIKKNGIKINKRKKSIIFFLLLLFGRIYKSKTTINSSPKISVFLPTYNKAKYLKKSIRSIQVQTMKNIEIITVNDCSEDNTLDLLMLFYLDNIYKFCNIFKYNKKY